MASAGSSVGLSSPGAVSGRSRWITVSHSGSVTCFGVGAGASVASLTMGPASGARVDRKLRALLSSLNTVLDGAAAASAATETANDRARILAHCLRMLRSNRGGDSLVSAGLVASHTARSGLAVEARVRGLAAFLGSTCPLVTSVSFAGGRCLTVSSPPRAGRGGSRREARLCVIDLDSISDLPCTVSVCAMYTPASRSGQMEGVWVPVGGAHPVGLVDAVLLRSAGHVGSAADAPEAGPPATADLSVGMPWIGDAVGVDGGGGGASSVDLRLVKRGQSVALSDVVEAITGNALGPSSLTAEVCGSTLEWMAKTGGGGRVLGGTAFGASVTIRARASDLASVARLRAALISRLMRRAAAADPIAEARPASSEAGASQANLVYTVRMRAHGLVCVVVGV